MPRPPCCRRVAHLPPFDLYRPSGASLRAVECRQVGLDEYEALRLADVEHLPQDEAAERLGVSRQTFGRILDAARSKVARALVEGCAIRIGGGPACPPPHPGWRCPRWGEKGPASPGECPRRLHCPSEGCPSAERGSPCPGHRAPHDTNPTE